MKLAWCGLILIAACHGKSSPPRDAKAWEDATTLLHGEIGGARLCCKDDMKAYDKFPEALKVAADESHNDCMKGTPDALAAVIKLVPGAKPFGTHANDPLMKSGSR